MEKLNKKDKEIIYFFKKFCREHGIWEIFKKYSIFLKRKSFYQLVIEIEPVKFLQNSMIFCAWSSIPTYVFNPSKFPQLSKEWGKLCIKHELFHIKREMLEYMCHHLWLTNDERDIIIKMLNEVK